MDQELDELRNEIMELSRTMRELGRIISALNDKEIEELEANLKDSNKSLKSNTKEIDKNTKAQEKLYKTYAEQGIIIDQYGKAIRSETAATEEAAEAKRKETKEIEQNYVYRRRERSAFQQLSEELSSTRAAGFRLQERLLSLAAGNKAAETAILMLEAGIKGLYKATKSLAVDLYKGQRGAAVSAKALSEFAETVGSAAQGIGLALTLIPGLGIAARVAGVALTALGVGAKTAGAVNELAAEQTDRLFKSFRELSTVGAGTVAGMDGVFDLVQTLGMTVAEIEDFNKIIVSNATAMGRFGATAAEGAKRFGEVAGTLYKSNLGRELEMLGVSAQEQREAALIYMSIQARTGQLQLRSTQQLVKESAAFVKELDLAAKLTGQTREDQARAREAALTEERFRSAVVAARLRGDEAELQRLNRAADIAGALKAIGDTRGATGALQIAAGGGALTTPDAIAAEMTFGIRQILSDPNAPLPEALRKMVENAQQQQRGLAETNRMIGTIESIQTNVVAIDDLVTRMQPIIDAAAKQGMTVTDFLKTEQGRQMAAGGDMRSMVDAGRLQQGAAMTMDSVVKSFNAAASVHRTATSVFNNAVNTFARTVGAQGVVGGVPGTGRTGGSPQRPGFSSGGQAQPTTGDYLSRLMQLESGGRNIATQIGGGTSSAFGLYQITRSTFESLASNAAPGSPLKGKTFEDMKTDTNLQRIAAQALTEGNANLLARRGLSTSDAAKYMAHVLGYPIAARVLEANSALGIDKLVPERSRLNNPKIFEGVSTAGDLRQRFSDITGGGGYRYGGVASGPKSGYTAVLHGTEAVVPLPDGKSIPVSMPDFSQGLREQIGMMSAQVGRLDDLISVMRDQVSVSNKILQVSRN